MIIDRRALLKAGAVVSAAALAPGISVASMTASGHQIERFVFDTRFTAAVDAGRAAAMKGIQLSSVDGDLTSLWYDDLNLRWKKQPMTLAGVTAEDALFVLGTLAPEYRMRVIHKEASGLARMQGPAGSESLPLYSWIIAPAD